MSRSLRGPHLGCAFLSRMISQSTPSPSSLAWLRSSGKLHHPLTPILVKTLPPLVTGLGADPVFLAQLSKVAGMNRFQYKLFPLVHRFYFFPRHPTDYPTLPAMCYLCSEPLVLPMY